MPKKCRSHVKESGTQWGQYNQQNNRVLDYNPGCRINTHNSILACIKESLNKKTKETVFSWQGISNNFHRQKWSTDSPHAHGVLPSKETLEKGRGSSFTGFSLGEPDRAVLGVQSPECKRAASAVSSHFDSAVTFMPSPCHRTSITGKARSKGWWLARPRMHRTCRFTRNQEDSLTLSSILLNTPLPHWVRVNCRCLFMKLKLY